MPVSRNFAVFLSLDNEPSFSTSPLQIATFTVFPSFTSFTSFALPDALVAVAVSGWLGETPLCLVLGRMGTLGMGHRVCSEEQSKGKSCCKRRTSEVASLLAEEPCRGAWPESRWGIGRREAETVVAYLHALLSCSVFHASSSAVKQ